MGIIDSFVIIIGGYNSSALAMILVLCFLVGIPMIKLHRAFSLLPIFGSLIFLAIIEHSISQVPNPPLALQLTPLLFSIAIIIGVFVGLNTKLKKKGGKNNARNQIQND